MIIESPALLAREQQILDGYTASLARLLAEETGVDPDDIEASASAAWDTICPGRPVMTLDPITPISASVNWREPPDGSDPLGGWPTCRRYATGAGTRLRWIHFELHGIFVRSQRSA